MGSLARGLIVLGAVLVLLGAALLLLERVPGLRPGKLPGDISISKGNWKIYFPLGTSLLVSLLLSALLSLVFWLFTRR
jgi:hypothetical protein